MPIRKRHQLNQLSVASVSLCYFSGGSDGPRPLTQDLRVPDDRADLPQGLLAGLLHLDVGVGQHLGQLGHDAGQAGGQLLGSAEGHGAQQLH